LFSVAAAIGLILIVWGYGIARRTPVVLWTGPVWAPHLAALVTAIAFVLLAASDVRGNHFKSGLRHPMVIAVMLWAVVHLIATGTLNAVVLFGAFLVWAVMNLASSLRRDRVENTVYPSGTLKGDAICVVAGLAVWALVVFVLHGWLIGVRPLG
jgi:uncharacterized membrane protein